MDTAITPSASDSTLIINVHAMLANSVHHSPTIALYQDSSAAIAVSSERFTSNLNENHNLHIQFAMAAGTTSETTFKVRFGPQSSATTTANGASGARKYGGTFYSAVTVQEISA